MTHTAIIQCRNMIHRLAGGGDTVMAGCAVADNARVVKRHFGEGGRTGMTHRAILCGGDVSGRQSGTDHAIVTRGTVAHHAGMVIHTGGEGSARGVANTAVFRGGHVVDGFAECGRIIMTGCTGLYREVDAGVVEDIRKRKAPGVMTPVAIIDGGRMGSRFSRRGDAIMAADTATDDDAVVESGCQKIIGDVTQAAITVGV